MSDNTKIEWAGATVNAVNGCSLASPGCTNCYAMRLAGTRMKHHPTRAGLTMDTRAGPVWTGEVRLHEPALLQPLRWKRPRRIFWNAHGDLFHPAVPDEWIDLVFAVCALTPQHTHMILTKRSARMREYLARHDTSQPGDSITNAAFAMNGVVRGYRGSGGAASWPLPNVWLGVSVEDQTRADERVPDLLDTPAAVRFLSCEPLLGPVDLGHVKMVDYITEGGGSVQGWESALNGKRFDEWADGDSEGWPKLDWVIAGGESGPGARPMHPDWARSLRDQCAAAGVPFHFKQWGEWAPQVGAVDGWTIPDDPEISRYDYRDWLGDHWSEPFSKGWQDDVNDDTVSRIGKKRAGRLLDGVEHNGLPA